MSSSGRFDSGAVVEPRLVSVRIPPKARECSCVPCTSRSGPGRQLGPPMRFSRTPAVRGVAGPPLGADTRAVLERAGVPAEVVAAVCAEEGRA